MQPLHTAVVVGDDHDFPDFQFEHGHQQAAHHRTPRVADDRAGVFNQFGVAVFQAERAREQLHHPRVHARQNRQPAFGVFVGKEFLVFAGIDELPVERKDAFQFAHLPLLSVGCVPRSL